MGVAGLRSSRPQSQRKTAFEGKKWSPFPPPRWETFTPPLTAWSLSNLVALLRQQLFVYRDLWAWLDEPFQAPPVQAAAQMGLGL